MQNKFRDLPLGRNQGALGHKPPSICNKQGMALFILKSAPFSLGKRH